MAFIEVLGRAACSLGQGIADAAGSWAGEQISAFLRERLDSGRPIAAAFESAGRQALDTVEYAFVAPLLKTSRKAVQFAQACEQEFLAGYLTHATGTTDLQAHAILRQALAADVAALRMRRLFGTQIGTDIDGIAASFANLHALNTPYAFLRLDAAAGRELRDAVAKVLESAEAPLVRLLDYQAQFTPPRNLLLTALAYHFRLVIAQSPEVAHLIADAKLSELRAEQAALRVLLDEQHEDAAGWFAEMAQELADAGSDVRNDIDEMRRAILANLDGLQAELADRMAHIDENLAGARVEIAEIADGQRAMESRLVAEIRAACGQLHIESRVKLRDSVSIHTPHEHELVSNLLARVRALPSTVRQQAQVRLEVGALLVAKQRFADAERQFRGAAWPTDANTASLAEFNAFQAALQAGDLSAALRYYQSAVAINETQNALFPAKYQPIAILGAGGFGVAFRCRQKFSRSDCVIKSLTNTEWLVGGTDEVFREAEILADLDHPNIVRVQDAEWYPHAGDANPRPYVVMEFFEAPSLEQYVAAHGPLPTADAIAIALGLARGLHAAHKKGVTHRDIKPGNILVRHDPATGEWQVKLIDFGLAVQSQIAQQSIGSGTGNTIVGQSILGTFDYSAPEQLGKLAAPIGPQADVYAFGKTLAFACFQTPTPTRRHWRTLDDTAPEFAEILEGAIEELPENRLPSFTDIVTMLEPLAAPAGPVASTSAAVEPTPLSGPAKTSPPSSTVIEIDLPPREFHALIGQSLEASAAAVNREFGTNFRWQDLFYEVARVESEEPPDTVVAEDAAGQITGSTVTRRCKVRVAIEPAVWPFEISPAQIGHVTPEQIAEWLLKHKNVRADEAKRAVEVVERRHNASHARGTISEQLSPGEGKGTRILKPLRAILSAGPKPKFREVPGFTPLGEQEFSCPNDVEGEKRFTLPVYRCDAFVQALMRAGKLKQEPTEIFVPGQQRNAAVDCEFVLLPPPGHDGRFVMGSPEPREYDDEGPQQEIQFRHSFLIARTAVTQRVYLAIGGAHDEFDWPGDMQPANEVSWNDITGSKGFIARAGLTGLRLPSEAEWEFACRAGTATAFCFGSGKTVTSKIVNFDGNNPYGGGPKSEYRQRTVEVGSLPMNGFGLFEVHGNVWEWCADAWVDSLADIPADGTARETTGASSRVYRGGSWGDRAVNCRSAIRDGSTPGRRSRDLGFRPFQALSD